MSSGRHDRSRPPHEQSRDKSRSRRDNDSRGPHRDRDSGRSISRDSRTQDAAQRGSDAHPDALRQQSRPPTASSKDASTSQSAQAPPAAQARPASGMLGAGHRTVFALEAARLLKQKAALSPAAASAATSGAAEDPEDGELPEAPEEAASKRRKHSPIVWSGVPPPSADAPGDTSLPSPPNLDNSPVSGLTGSPARGLVQAGNAAGRAAAELAEFQNQQMLNDIDPDAPAAMKASPSVSGESDAGDIGNGVTSAAVTLSLGPGVTVHAAVTATGGGADTALANVLDAAAAVTQPRNKWEAAMSEEEAAGADLSEEAHMAALNARERQEIAEGQGLQTPEHDGDPMQTDGSPESDVTTAPSMLQQCRSVQNFERLNCINEGTYGMVYRARETASGKILALKKIKMEREKEGFPLTSIREINILLALHHKNIVNVTEVVVGKKMDDIFMVMEFMEHDLKGLMEAQDGSGPVFAMSEIKCLMHQLILGVEYLHKNWVIHRDLKTSNILYNNKGDLKICDFGLARQYGSPLRPYTHMVVTLWYRAPELLLGVKEYSTAIDMWSVGCIMGELILNKPLLPGKSEMEQIHKIFSLVGTPTAENWPKHTDLPNLNKFKFPPTQPKLSDKFPVRRFDFDGRSLSEAGFELLNGLLTLDPERRFTAEQARNHRWFKEQPYSKDLAMMPTFPVKQGEGSHHRKVQKVHKRQDSPRDP